MAQPVRNVGVVSPTKTRGRRAVAAGAAPIALSGPGISAAAFVAVLINLSFVHHLGTRSRTAVALKIS